MKLTAGVHPDLPMPFTNGPEPPEDPVQGLPEPLRLATARHDEGRKTVASMVGHWLLQSGLSLEQLCTIAAWGLNERGMLDRGTLSRIRTGAKARGASFGQIDALSAANMAIWLWQVRGKQKAWAKLGPHSGWGVKDEWMDNATWLPHPDHPNDPLEFGDMAEVLVGHLDLPYLGPAPLSAADARIASAELPRLLDRLAAERGWGAMAGLQGLMDAYPVGDRGRQQRMKRVITGEQLLSADELESELHAISEMVRQVRRLKAGEYGPRELQAELMSGGRLGHG
jgi:hypothetical protein